MSWGKVAAGVGVAVVAVIGVAVGKVWGNAEGEEDRKKMNEENENLRKEIRSVLEIFKSEMERKDEEIVWLEEVTEQLIKSPPQSMPELDECLRAFKLTDSQVDLVVNRTAPIFKSQK
ncbi:hypothetical protein [Thalassospira marina]|uniref:Uncharacterized protein n=1 Tax=Thalassospira marina TaxID=2048283 RepID=A0ABM6QAB7_9PROT|nr:hypothetical protein [Thalassospira marina]AUG53487.1 hypothetical protein CSC3H3_12760 [Thalassospira marina]